MTQMIWELSATVPDVDEGDVFTRLFAQRPSQEQIAKFLREECGFSLELNLDERLCDLVSKSEDDDPLCSEILDAIEEISKAVHEKGHYARRPKYMFSVWRVCLDTDELH